MIGNKGCIHLTKAQWFELIRIYLGTHVNILAIITYSLNCLDCYEHNCLKFANYGLDSSHSCNDNYVFCLKKYVQENK